MKLITIFAVAMATQYGMAQTKCVELQPDSDVGIDAAISNRSDFIDENFGSYNALRLHAGTGNNVGSNEQDWRALTKLSFFDELPEGTIIESASITLTNNTDEGYFEAHGDNAGTVYLLTEDWEEDVVTWNTQPAYDETSSIVAIPSQSSSFTTLELDITDMVKEIVEDGKPNYGFMMRLNNENPYSAVVFASSDYQTVELRPLWKVCYNDEVTIVKVDENTECATIKPGSESGIDASISNRSDFIDENFGTYNALRLHAGTGNNVGSNEQDWRALTKLAYLDNLPEGAIIESASIKLFNNTDQGYFEAHGDNAGTVYLLTEDWDEDLVTWNTQPAYDVASSTVAISAQSSSFNTLELDLTNMVKEIVEVGKPNYGFMMRLDNENPYSAVVFTSSDYDNVDLLPVWEVCYTTSSISGTFKTVSPASFNVYPNPTTGLIQFSEAVSGVLQTIQGHELEAFNEVRSLDLTGYDPGVYVITRDDGTSQKVVMK